MGTFLWQLIVINITILNFVLAWCYSLLHFSCLIPSPASWADSLSCSIILILSNDSVSCRWSLTSPQIWDPPWLAPTPNLLIHVCLPFLSWCTQCSSEKPDVSHGSYYPFPSLLTWFPSTWSATPINSPATGTPGHILGLALMPPSSESLVPLQFHSSKCPRNWAKCCFSTQGKRPFTTPLLLLKTYFASLDSACVCTHKHTL